MDDDFNEQETIDITGNSADALPFFQNILDDASILERIPKGATITILPTHPGEQRAAAQQATVAVRSLSSFEVGDQTVYILAVRAEDHAAD